MSTSRLPHDAAPSGATVADLIAVSRATAPGADARVMLTGGERPPHPAPDIEPTGEALERIAARLEAAAVQAATGTGIAEREIAELVADVLFLRRLRPQIAAALPALARYRWLREQWVRSAHQVTMPDGAGGSRTVWRNVLEVLAPQPLGVRQVNEIIDMRIAEQRQACCDACRTEVTRGADLSQRVGRAIALAVDPTAAPEA